MKVVDLQCDAGHRFEGWFASQQALADQQERGLLSCPLCGDTAITQLPSAPRLNLSGAPARSERAEQASEAGPGAAAGASKPHAPHPQAEAPDARVAELQARWLQGMRRLMAETEDVGPRFAQEALRIHHGEAPERAIRGQASAEQRAALAEEGVEVFSLPVPEGFGVEH